MQRNVQASSASYPLTTHDGTPKNHAFDVLYTCISLYIYSYMNTGPEAMVLLHEQPVPEPGDGEVLIEVCHESGARIHVGTHERICTCMFAYGYKHAFSFYIIYPPDKQHARCESLEECMLTCG